MSCFAAQFVGFSSASFLEILRIHKKLQGGGEIIRTGIRCGQNGGQIGNFVLTYPWTRKSGVGFQLFSYSNCWVGNCLILDLHMISWNNLNFEWIKIPLVLICSFGINKCSSLRLNCPQCSSSIEHAWYFSHLDGNSFWISSPANEAFTHFYH